MPDSYLYPDATDSNDWPLQGEASAHLCVDDDIAAPDDDTTYLYVNAIPGAAKTAILSFDDWGGGGPIELVYIYGRAKTTAPDTAVKMYMRQGGSNYAEAESDGSGAYAWDAGAEQSTCPDSGDSWVKANVDTLKTEITCSTGNNTRRCTAVLFTVRWDYVDGGGGGWLLAEWMPPIVPLLPLVGACISNREIMQMSWATNKKSCPTKKRDFEIFRRGLWQLCRQAIVVPPLWPGVEPQGSALPA